MKRITLIFLLAFCFFTQIVKAEDDAVLMWEHYNLASIVDIEFSPTDPNVVVALELANDPWKMNNAFIFDVQTGDTVRIIEFDIEDDDLVFTFTFSNDGEKLIFGTKQEYILVYNISEDRFEHSFQLEGFKSSRGWFDDIEFTPDGKYLVVSCHDIFIINADDWTVKQQWNGVYYYADDFYPPEYLNDSPRDISLSYDSKYVSCIFGYADEVIIYDIEKNDMIKKLDIDDEHAQFLNHSNKIILDQEGYFLEYDLTKGEERVIEPGGSNMIISENDGLMYIMGTGLHETSVFNISENSVVGKINAITGSKGLVAVKNDKYFFTGNLAMYDISAVTSVKDSELALIQITPNPAENILRITNLPVEIQLIEISDIEGRVIDSFSLTSYNEYFEIDISGYSNGTYFVNFITESTVFTKKFIIER